MIDLTDPMVFLPLSALVVFAVIYFGPIIRKFVTNGNIRISVRCVIVALLLALVGAPATISSGIWLAHAVDQPELIPRVQAGACLGVSAVIAIAAIGALIGALVNADSGN